jgi:hypothetical protein
MKIIDLLNAQPAMQQLTSKHMSAKLAYAIAKNSRLINAELEDYNKTRLKLLSDNWVLNPETSKYDIPDEDQAKWKAMHDELIDSECDYVPFKINMALIETFDWSPGELMTLWFIFEGDGASDLAPQNSDTKVEL